MCRVFGAVAAAPISIRHELVEATNPLIVQSEDHDSGWGVAAYADVGAEAPHIERFPMAAHADGRFDAVTGLQGRIFNAHVRRATLGGISPENTHPFDLGPYTFSHNGTILNYRSLLMRDMPEPKGDTDSECFFLRLMNAFDPEKPVNSIRGVIATLVAGHTFSGLNFVLSDGIKLYAYRLGVFDLFWATRRGMSMVASEELTPEKWHCVQQDVLLTLDPENPEEPHAERLIGDMLLEQARIEKLEPEPTLKGAARGEWAARHAVEAASTNGAAIVQRHLGTTGRASGAGPAVPA